MTTRHMRTEPSPEIIEVIDDDVDAFGEAAGTEDTRRQAAAWVGPTAAVVLVALVGYGVLSSAITSDDTTAPVDPALIDPVYYVAEAPPGFGMYLAEQRGDAGTDTNFAANGPAEMWATPDATATQGAWFVVSAGTHHSTGRSSYRTVVNGVEVVFERGPAARQSRLSFTKNGYDLEITALGWLDRQLVRLVRSVTIDGTGLRFDNDFFSTDHERVLLADPATALEGLPAARVGYATGLPAAFADNFTITVAGDNVADRETVTKFALTNTASFTVGDLPAIIGQSASDPTESVAQWRDGQRLITMRGNIAGARLEAIAQTVHPSDSDVDRDAARQPNHSASLRPERGKTVVSGMLADGSPWVIQVDTWIADDSTPGYLWWIGQPDGGLVPRLSLTEPGPSIETFVEHGRTYVLARVPRSLPGTELHVNPNGLPSVVTPLYEVDPTLAAEFAASVFLEPVPFTARITDADGTTIASWPTF